MSRWGALAVLVGLVLFTHSLKATPEDFPSGPDIEPYTDKPPATFLVPKGVTNLAAGCKVTSSTPPLAGELAQITDGKKEAFDFDIVELRVGLQWVQVDLVESKSLFAIVMWHNHRKSHLVRDVIVQVSDDPEFRAGVTTLYSNDRDGSAGLGKGTERDYFETKFGRIVNAKGIKARYIRCYSNGSDLTKENFWQEIEAYGHSANSTGPGTTATSTNAVHEAAEPLILQLPAPTLK